MNESTKISGGTSYKIYYDASMLMALNNGITDVWRNVGERPTRQFFQYEIPGPLYQGHISTPTEKLLTWQPMATTITFFALIASIAVWIIR